MVIEQENIREIDDDLNKSTLQGSFQDNVTELPSAVTTKECREQKNDIIIGDLLESRF